MTFKTRLTTAIATGAVLLNAIAPAAFAQDITVSQNGAKSDNNVNVSSNTSTVVSQNNNANVINNVSSNSSTGGNKANNNTGGDVTVNTGSANTSVNVSNQLNTNSANVSGCGACAGGGADVNISKNGAKSDNAVNVNNNSGVFVNQTNNANVTNNVNAKSDTGNNKANGNTGTDVHVQSGNATTNVSVETKANVNAATISGGNGNGGSSVTIFQNGAKSDNTVNLDQNSAVVLGQANEANVVNNVDAKALTGKNKANYNTGGDVTVKSGDATSDVAVKNAVNFNAADVDCGCLLDDLDVTVEKNGAKSDNAVNADSETLSHAGQANDAYLLNDVEGNAKTGKNESDLNGGDPLVKSGNIDSSTDVNNAGNVNLFDQGASLDLPSDWDFDFHFDLHGLFGFLHSWTV